MSVRTHNPRRQFRRIRTELPLWLWPAGRGDLLDYREGQTVDLSAGGLFCRCDSFDQEFLDDLGTAQPALDLQIQLARGAYRVQASGRIVWSEEHAGEFFLRVCFTGFLCEAEQTINRFLHNVTPC